MAGKTTILGSGAMATACSVLLAEHPGQSVAIWARSADHARAMQEQRENRRLLPGIMLPDSVRITADIDEALAAADSIVVAVPTEFLRASLSALAPAIDPRWPVISVVKGLERETFLRPSQIIQQTLGSRSIVALCGPSHAEEIGRRLPASVVAAGTDIALARQVQEMFATDRFRVYSNSDLIGVELAGALKNVIAIAAGISDGLGYGDNAKAALMTRGIVEIMRLGTGLGADAGTFWGLAGIGDLITTCVSPHGRNRRVGERLGRGETLDQIRRTMDELKRKAIDQI
ncbi:MAG: NAD(P)H-dependent glycerol-3-phosphate dehydrogenase, partial [Pirellulales bacterium]